MSYGVALSSEAQRALDALPAEIASACIDELELLASAPVRLSRPAVFPYAAGEGQIYSFERGPFRVTIFFRYHADETTLDVYAIGFVQYG
jgi:mRNA-degrading endonuclease RelE of RelBE toxin-antitoxin system